MKGRCSIEGADLAPSVVEDAASERPRGDQVEKLAEAVITDEAETAERLKKTDWPEAAEDSDT